MFECPREEMKGPRSLGITQHGAELGAPKVSRWDIGLVF